MRGSGSMIPLDEAGIHRFRAGAGKLYQSPQWVSCVRGRVSAKEFAYLAGPGADATAYTFVLDAPSSYSSFDPVQLGLNGELGSHRLRHYPALVCATPNAYAPPFGGGGQDVSGILPALEELATTLGCPTIGILYMDAKPFQSLRAPYQAAGFRPALMGASAELTFQNASPRHFMATFPSRRRRVLAKEMAGFADSGLRVEEVDPKDFDEHLASLQLKHDAQFGLHGDMDHVLRSYAATRAAIGQFLHLLVMRAPNGQSVGFLTFFLYEGEGYPGHIGLDRQRLEPSAFAYFNLAYYQLWQYLPDSTRVMHYGPSAYGAKVLRGCRLEPLYGFLRFEDGYTTESAARRLTELHATGVQRFVPGVGGFPQAGAAGDVTAP